MGRGFRACNGEIRPRTTGRARPCAAAGADADSIPAEAACPHGLPVGAASSVRAAVAVFLRISRRRCVPTVANERHDLGTEDEVILPAELLLPQASEAVDKNLSRGSLHAIAGHRLRRPAAVGRRVGPDGKVDLVFVQERGQRHAGTLRTMVLEDRMQSDDGDLTTIEDPMHAHGLGQSVGNASRTQHLERLDQNDLATQRVEQDGLVGVEPIDGFQLRRSHEIHLHSPLVHSAPLVRSRHRSVFRGTRHRATPDYIRPVRNATVLSSPERRTSALTGLDATTRHSAESYMRSRPWRRFGKSRKRRRRAISPSSATKSAEPIEVFGLPSTP